MTQNPRAIDFNPSQFDSFQNLAEAFFHNASRNPEHIAYDRGIALDDLTVPREYRETTRAESMQRVLKIADYFESAGVKKGDNITIVMASRPEWSEAENAVFACGGAVINAYVRDTTELLGFKIDDTKSKYIVVENQEQLDKIAALVRDGCNIPAIEDRAAYKASFDISRILTIEEVDIPAELEGKVDTLKTVLERQVNRAPEEFRIKEVSREDLANIIYTSGSSGPPKGVPLTHGENLANIRQLASCGYVQYDDIKPTDGSDPTITFLIPERGHAYMARMDQLAATSPVKSRFPAVADTRSNQLSKEARAQMQKDLKEGAAGLVPVVPKVLVRMQQEIEGKLAGPGIKNWILRKTIDIGQRYYLQNSKGTASLYTKVAFALTTPIRNAVSSEVKSKLVGPKFQFFGSGGAKLPAETNAFFWTLGMPVLEGYGATETNCPITMNTPSQAKMGTAGKSLADDLEYRNDETTGELLVRGPNIARGYWNRPQATKESWTEDGWYKTKDKAFFDADKFLVVEERIDNILVLENGENVAAFAVEERMLQSPFIQEAIVYGHGKAGLVALVCVDYKAAKEELSRRGAAVEGDLSQNVELKRLIAEDIKLKVNNSGETKVFEKIRNFDIIPALTVEEGTMTSTQKVQRKKVAEVHAERLDRLYAERENWM